MGGPGVIDDKYHDETDNFLFVKFTVNGKEYCSAENYFQCAKTTNKEDHEYIRSVGPGMESWAAGNEVELRKDWESVKVKEMYIGNKARFEQHPDLAKKLCSSKGKVIFEASSPFWNKWNGLIMERIRAEMRNQDKEDQETAKSIKKLMEDYELQNKSL